ncbi:YgjV family protein [Marinagarivorans cellulosilyticus]|nr:YgjV family protein [Marinagarivorans cellulosilyticus]
MVDQFWAQALGMLSFALGLFCFFQKDDARLKYVMLAVTLNNAVHFALLGATTSVIAALFSAVRTGASLYTSSKYVAYAFILGVLVFGAYAAQSWLDMLPVIGASIGTYALFCLNGIPMRVALLGGTLCWLINNVLIGSIGGSLLELSLLVVNLNTIRRLHLTALKPQH